MIRVLRCRGVLLCGLFTDFKFDEEDYENYKEARGLYIKDPWERVKLIFSKDDHGDQHPELKLAKDMFTAGLVVGGLYGGLINSTIQGEAYLHRNDMNIFGSKRQALAAFANHNTITFLKGSLMAAPRFGIFFGGFSLISSCCEAYSNRSKITDSVIAGAVMGSLCKFSFGIKGMISGGVVGGTLGTLYGVIVWSVTTLTKTDQLKIKYSQFALKKYREKMVQKVWGQPLQSSESKYFGEGDNHSLHEHNPLNLLVDEAENVAESSYKTNKSE